MAWNGPPNFNHASVPFWDFMAALDPSHARGAGVDHTGPEFPGMNFGPGFPFGPGGFEGWGRRRGGGPWRHWGGEDWAEGPWGRRGSCRGRRFRRGFPGGAPGSGDEEQPPQYTDEERAAATGGEENDKEMGGMSGNEKQDSPATLRDETADPPEEIPDPREHRRGHHHGRHGGGPGRRGRGGFGFRGEHPHGPPHHGPGFGPGPFGRGPHHHHGPPPPPPFGGPHGPHGAGFPFDFTPLIQAFASHPYAQQVREYLERAQNATGNNTTNDRAAAENEESNDSSDEDAESFAPPVDIFETATSWVLHVAVPGAKKEDVGVNWDADKSVLGVSGVVYRPGDEAFLQGLVSGERRVGLFARDVRLPPEGSETKDEVESEGIAAKMEDGVLVVTVPKVEKEWTEVRKVDIE